MNLKYLSGALITIPLLPLMYYQGKKIRARVPKLPEAKEPEGQCLINGKNERPLKIISIGESTIAGVGVQTHEEGFTGTLAKEISTLFDLNVDWKVYARSGYTAKKVENKIYLQGRNISEREQYRQNLSDHQDRLKEAEALGNIGQWEWIIGTEFIQFSEQLCKIFGLNDDQRHPKFDEINSMIHQDDEDRMMQVFQRAMIEQKNYDLDFRIETPQGETRHIKCEGRCKTDQNG
ncbi:MAG: PAS domain-containing protein, partial [Bacteroidota bacterium]